MKWLEVDKHFFETTINGAFPRSAHALCVLALNQTRVQRRTKICAAARASLEGRAICEKASIYNNNFGEGIKALAAPICTIYTIYDRI